MDLESQRLLPKVVRRAGQREAKRFTRTPWVMLVITDPCTPLACEVVRDDVSFSRPKLCGGIRSSPASATMESENKWNEIVSSETTAKVEVMQ